MGVLELQLRLRPVPSIVGRRQPLVKVPFFLEFSSTSAMRERPSQGRHSCLTALDGGREIH
jgi:hypothetical protein